MGSVLDDDEPGEELAIRPIGAGDRHAHVVRCRIRAFGHGDRARTDRSDGGEVSPDAEAGADLHGLGCVAFREIGALERQSQIGGVERLGRQDGTWSMIPPFVSTVIAFVSRFVAAVCRHPA